MNFFDRNKQTKNFDNKICHSPFYTVGFDISFSCYVLDVQGVS